MDNFYGKVIGLSKEARAVNDIFENNGFKVYSVACKNGSRPKEEIRGKMVWIIRLWSLKETSKK
ncbi:MAG: DUF1847 domain-containing protein [Eubacteriales bacterium]